MTRSFFNTLLIAGCALTTPLFAEAFTDDFTRPLADSWNPLEGNWSLRDGRAVVEGKFSRLEKKDFSEQDVEVSADVTYISEEPHASAGIQVRCHEGGGYAIGLREIERGIDPKLGLWERPLLQLYRMEKSGWKLLQESKVVHCQSGKAMKLKVQCKGPNVFVYCEDMQTPVIREFDDQCLQAGNVALWKDQLGGAEFDNVNIAPVGATPEAASQEDWSWVKGTVYVRSNAVNTVQMWDDYWPHTAMMDRELGYSATYGFNMVQVYLHWIVWDKYGDEYLKRIDDFLTRAAAHVL